MLSLAEVLAAIILVALTAYVLFGGADFGGGVWDLLASGPRAARQRDLIARAIGPVWEANHVWLILAIVLLFTSPVLLGACVGAIASGAVGEHGARSTEPFYSAYVAPWLTPFAIAVGIFALTCFAFLAAVYLTLETTDAALQDDFRQRAIAAGTAVFAMAVIGLALFPQAPPVNDRVVALTAAAAIGAFWSLWRRRYSLARIAAAGEVTLILWGWGLSQYPYLLPPDLTIAAAAAPRITLELVLIAVIAGAVVLFPSLYYLMRVFKGKSGLGYDTRP